MKVPMLKIQSLWFFVTRTDRGYEHLGDLKYILESRYGGLAAVPLSLPNRKWSGYNISFFPILFILKS